MNAMRRDRAVEAFARLPLSVRNRKLASYWLSLWKGDALPMRADFSPGQMRDLLPGLAIFEVRPDVSTRCRLAGTLLHRAIGREITGCDWREYTPEPQWAARLERNTVIATGAVGIGVRQNHQPEALQFTQELQLPFADQTEDGARLLLLHLDWRPVSDFTPRAKGNPVRIADEFHTVRLAD